MGARLTAPLRLPSSSASAPRSAVRGPHGGGDMKISDAVIDLRTDWHPRIARFLEGNAGRAGRVAQDNPGHSARGPKRATERKTKARSACQSCLPHSCGHSRFCQTKKSAAAARRQPPMPRFRPLSYTSCVLVRRAAIISLPITT